VLRKWFGDARYTYNACLTLCESDKANRNAKALRAAIVASEAVPEDKRWLLDTPYNIRDGAVNDLLEAYKTNFAKRKKDAKHTFHMRFRSRKASSQSIDIRKGSFSKRHPGVFFEKQLGKTPMRASETLPTRETIHHDCKLIHTRSGHFYLAVLHEAPARATESRRPIVAIDPGIRTFATGYAPGNDGDGLVFEVGKADVGRIHRLCHHADRLRSKIDAKGARNKHRKQRALWRMGERIHNLVAELHWKLANFLCCNFEAVLLPTFGTQRMSARATRCLTKRSTRAMLTWSHYAFRQRLVSKAEEYGTQVILCDESYTSKTCGRCGALHFGLGGRKTFHCPHCGATCDRDVNGARNILLRALLV
jgi:putative transposase